MDLVLPVALSSAGLEHPVSDPQDRSIMPMSTLIASNLWLLETTWDGSRIGDVQIYLNKNSAPSGTPLTDPKTGEPLSPDWRWWNAVPCAKVAWYRFLDASKLTPATLEDEGMPFELDDDKREEKSRPSREAKS